MANELEPNIVTRVQTLLEADNGLSAPELLSRLEEYIKQIHPDRFIDPTAKAESEAKFKVAEALRAELVAFIQMEAVRLAPADLVRQGSGYELVIARAGLAEANKEINTLRSKIESLEHQLKQLEQKDSERGTSEFEAERKRLENLYKPSPTNWLSLGATLTLSCAVALMNKIEQISAILKQYSPVDEKTLRAFTFGFLVLVIFFIVKMLAENAVMKRRVREVCSTKTAVEFYRHVEPTPDRYSHTIFTEYQVFEFIYGPPKSWNQALSKLGFVHFQEVTADQLKDFFIQHLLRKELIALEHAERLDRTFSVKNKSSLYR